MKKISFGLFWIGSTAFASLGACHSDAGSSSIDVTPVNNFIQAQAQAACDWEFNCCTDAEIKALDTNKYSTKQQCVAYQLLSQEDNLYLTRLAVSEGRIRVDSTHAAACIQEMSKRACNPAPGKPLPPPPSPAVNDCAQALTGTTPVGSECIYPKECVLGAHCVSDAQAVGRGVCVPYQKVGDICNADTDCDPATEQIYCAQQDFKCHVRGKIGEACAYTASLNATGAGVTLPMLLECDQSKTGNEYCDPSSKTCKTLPGAGEACLAPLPPGVQYECNPDPSLKLACSTTGIGTGAGTCKAPGKAGDDCSTTPCSVDLYCNRSGTTSVCTALPGLGQPCTPSQQCVAPYFCAFSATTGAATCSKPAALGQDCSTVSCDTGLYCDTTGPSSVCASQLPDGTTCNSSRECRSLVCGGTPRVCQPSLNGQACTGR